MIPTEFVVNVLDCTAREVNHTAQLRPRISKTTIACASKSPLAIQMVAALKLCSIYSVQNGYHLGK